MPTLEAALSVDRLSTYRLWAGNNQALAVRLYTFNVQLSAALYGPLHMLEVALRNVADAKLTAIFGNEWMDNADVLKTGYQQRCIRKARAQLEHDKKAGSHGQMVAELNFGFWSSLFGRPSSHLWQHLRPIFAAEKLQRHSVALQLDNFRHLRNRVAHYEPIVQLPLAQRYADIVTLTGWLSPSAAAWINSTSEWSDTYPGIPILVRNPDTGLSSVGPGVIDHLPA